MTCPKCGGELQIDPVLDEFKEICVDCGFVIDEDSYVDNEEQIEDDDVEVME